MAVNEENRIHGMDISHQNVAEITRPHSGGPPLIQPVFDWNTEDKYMELKGLQFIQTPTAAQQEICQAVKIGLWDLCRFGQKLK